MTEFPVRICNCTRLRTVGPHRTVTAPFELHLLHTPPDCLIDDNGQWHLDYLLRYFNCLPINFGIEHSINHEWIHEIIAKLEGELTCGQFDNVQEAVRLFLRGELSGAIG